MADLAKMLLSPDQLRRVLKRKASIREEDVILNDPLFNLQYFNEPPSRVLAMDPSAQLDKKDRENGPKENVFEYCTEFESAAEARDGVPQAFREELGRSTSAAMNMLDDILATVMECDD